MDDIVKRLQELLDLKDTQLEEKDAQLEECEHTINQLQGQLDFGTDWMLHVFGKKDRETLPVPRLHLALTEDTPYYQEFSLSLVIPGAGSQVTYVPIGYSKRGCNASLKEDLPLNGELADYQVNSMPSLLYDGILQMEALKLPMYVQMDAEHIYIVTAGRPIKMRAV